MKNKGFTLVELLAVLILLAILTLLIVPNVSKSINFFRRDSIKKQTDNILTAASNWVSHQIEHNPNILPKDGENVLVTIGELKNAGFLEINIKNPSNNKLIPNTDIVTITRNGQSFVPTYTMQ